MAAAPKSTPPARRKRGFEPAAKLVAGHMRGPMEKRGFAQARLLTHWAEIVGPDLARIALPVKISHGRGFGGTLVLLTTGGNAPVLEMQKEQIIEKVNACYGHRAVNKVQITQTAPVGFAEGQVAFAPAPKAPPPPPDPVRLDAAMGIVNRVTDAGLKEALAGLARNVISKQST